jgi:hypothetical protein
MFFEICGVTSLQSAVLIFMAVRISDLKLMSCINSVVIPGHLNKGSLLIMILSCQRVTV